jgi:raffinose/stachyose/melibiose transport system substrate-binding protein
MSKAVKLAGLAAVAGGLAIAFAGLGGTAQSAPTAFPTGPVKLTMWWWGEQEAKGAKEWLKQTIALYQKKHPNVTIKTVLQTTDGLVPAFKAAAAAKKGPDIQYFWGGIWSLEDAWAGSTKPASDYIPKSELRHYLNASEDTFDGKVWTAPWYVQPSFPILYRKDVLAKAGVKLPQTWTQLLAACDKLNAKGVTPFEGGVKDGWFGGWLYATIGSQSVNSVGDLLAAVAGKQKFTDPQHAGWWSRLQEMRDHKCWNKDINSQTLYPGQDRWAAGKGAMTMTAGSDVKKFVEKVGVARVGVMTMPKWANGPYAGRLGSTSQTLGITAWTKYPEVVADFIMFTHTPGRMTAFFNKTGSFPADDRFNTKLIKLPQQKELFAKLKNGAPYLENFIPAEFDAKANFAHVQLLLAGRENAKQAAAASEQVAARLRRVNRDLVSNFATWAKSYP